ncbi:hypothetical protein CYME_CMP188C [Cyanidioschyzon merolae strain 10D]|uniref:Uncharacterized protein n=1 Tax=Cyanidioschyzon merolae (strain NIES-3377 / 10D) TaxID=280699 RepID=M1VFR1_CYAM1|nr:hypothetical protein CYME_CMP188C [Cyanidioschyzon merolae strain 10D]BAM81817.1 hypothetical protein CYME_CMP188C [Cyanidioschyzon merolae strain 10D]|eukprot:XP_005537853.1 hypothetical protein CYME_CMP188C [Cyanidioschyzon merolae strain 10D]
MDKFCSKLSCSDEESARQSSEGRPTLGGEALDFGAPPALPFPPDASLGLCRRLEIHGATCSCVCEAFGNMGSHLDSLVPLNTADVLAKVRSAAKRLATRLDETADEERLRQTCLSLCDLFGDGIHHDLIQAVLDAGVVPRVVRILEPLIDDDGSGSGTTQDADGHTSDAFHSPMQRQRDGAATSRLNEERTAELLETPDRSGDSPGPEMRHSRVTSRDHARASSGHAASTVRKRSRRREVSLGLQSAALQVIGNIACGDDRQTQVIIDCPNALTILRTLLASVEPCIQKECCWIISNITESAHQVQDIVRAGILEPLVGIFSGGHESCDEDAAWVLYNVTASGDPEHIRYLANIGGISALCALILSPAELEVAWKGCATVAAVALHALSNMLTVLPNEMPYRIAAEYGVECLDLLAHGGGRHIEDDENRRQARELLSRHFQGKSVSETAAARRRSANETPMLASLGSQRPSASKMEASANDAQVHLVASGTAGKHAPQICTDESVQTSTYIDEVDYAQACSTATTGGLVQTGSADAERLCECSASEVTLKQLPYGDISDVKQMRNLRACSFCSGLEPRYDVDASDFIGCTRRDKCTALMARAVRVDHNSCLESIIDAWLTMDDVDLVVERLIPDAGKIYVEYQEFVSRICNFLRSVMMETSTLSCAVQMVPPEVGTGTPGTQPPWPSERASSLTASRSVDCEQSTQDRNRCSIITLASQLGRAECLQTILSRMQPLLVPEWRDFLYSSLLAGAAYKGHLNVVQTLLAYWCNSVQENGRTRSMRGSANEGHGTLPLETIDFNALHLAAAAGQYKTCSLLLKGFPEALNLTSSMGHTALSFAALFGYTDVCRLLLEKGADIWSMDTYQRTALHLACVHGRTDTVALLVEHARKVLADQDRDAFTKWLNARTTTGITALHYSIQSRVLACVELLVTNGACIKDRLPNSGPNPLLVLAADADSLEIVQFLLEAGAPVRSVVPLRIRIGDTSDTLSLSSPEDSLHAEIEDFFTPLHVAANKGSLQLVQMLLESGADVNVRGVTGWSALDLAVLNGFDAVASLLLSKGAIVDPHLKIIPSGIVGQMPSAKTLVQIAAMNHRKDLVRMLVERLRVQSLNSESANAGVSSACLVSASPAGGADVSTTCSVEGPDTGQHGAGESVGALDAPNDRGSASVDVSESTGSKKRQESDKDSQRNRELRRRELEANDARERLRDAIQTRSLTKLQDAIGIANRVILQLAASYVKSGSAKLVGPEIGLGAEVERARRVLAALQEQQQRVAADRERLALEARQDAAHRKLLESIASFFSSSDVRVFDKAIRRASKAGLDPSDSVMQSVTELRSRWTEMQDAARGLDDYLNDEHRLGEDAATVVRGLEGIISKAEHALERFSAFSPEAAKCSAAERVRDSIRRAKERANEVQKLVEEKARLFAVEEAKCREICERLDQICAVLRQGRSLVDAPSSLTEAENAIELFAVQVTKSLQDSTLQLRAEEHLEQARRALQKIVRNERKRLRSVATLEDITAIDELIDSVRQLGLKALSADLSSAMEVRERRILQREALADWEEVEARRSSALELDEVLALQSRLEQLGLIEAAEKARQLADHLAREQRAAQTLKTATDEAREALSSYAEVDADSCLQQLLSRAGDSLDRASLEKLRRLRVAIERARKFDSLAEIVHEAQHVYEAFLEIQRERLQRICNCLRAVPLEDVPSLVQLKTALCHDNSEKSESDTGVTRDEARCLVAAQVLREISDRVQVLMNVYANALNVDPENAENSSRGPYSVIPSALVDLRSWLEKATCRCTELHEAARQLQESRATESLMVESNADGASEKARSQTPEVVDVTSKLASPLELGSSVPSEMPSSGERSVSSQRRSGRRARNRRGSASAVPAASESREAASYIESGAERMTASTTVDSHAEDNQARRSTKGKSLSEKKKGGKAGRSADSGIVLTDAGADETESVQRKAGSADPVAEEVSRRATPSLETTHRKRQTAKRAETGESAGTGKQETRPSEGSGIRESGELVAPEAGCPHYYIWTKSNIVVCGKCGDVRISHNQNWLERVKKRTQKKKDQVPAEFLEAVESALLARRRRSTSRSDTNRAPGDEQTAALQNDDSYDSVPYTGPATSTGDDSRASDPHQDRYPRPTSSMFWTTPAAFPIGEMSFVARPSVMERSPSSFQMRQARLGYAAPAESLEMSSRPGTPARPVSPFVNAFPSPGRNVVDGRANTPLYADMILGMPDTRLSVAANGAARSPCVTLYREARAAAATPMGRYPPSLGGDVCDANAGVWLQPGLVAGATTQVPFPNSIHGSGQAAEPSLDPVAHGHPLRDERGHLFGMTDVFHGHGVLNGVDDALLSSSPVGVGDSEFASQNFGFNIDAIVDENPQPRTTSKDKLAVESDSSQYRIF